MVVKHALTKESRWLCHSFAFFSTHIFSSFERQKYVHEASFHFRNTLQLRSRKISKFDEYRVGKVILRADMDSIVCPEFLQVFSFAQISRHFERPALTIPFYNVQVALSSLILLSKIGKAGNCQSIFHHFRNYEITELQNATKCIKLQWISGYLPFVSRLSTHYEWLLRTLLDISMNSTEFYEVQQISEFTFKNRNCFTVKNQLTIWCMSLTKLGWRLQDCSCIMQPTFRWFCCLLGVLQWTQPSVVLKIPK